MNNSQLESLQNLYGNSKVFAKVTTTAKGREYLFDDDFINVLEDFLKGGKLFDMNKSDRNNIEKFIKLADGELDITSKDYETLVEFNKYLGGL